MVYKTLWGLNFTARVSGMFRRETKTEIHIICSSHSQLSADDTQHLSLKHLNQMITFSSTQGSFPLKMYTTQVFTMKLQEKRKAENWHYVVAYHFRISIFKLKLKKKMANENIHSQKAI